MARHAAVISRLASCETSSEITARAVACDTSLILRPGIIGDLYDRSLHANFHRPYRLPIIAVCLPSS